MVGKSQDAKGQDPDGEASCFGGQRCCSSRTAPSSSLLAALLFSVVSIVSCVYLGMKTNDLQARVLAIETAQGDIFAAASASASNQLMPSYTLDQLNSLMQDKVEQLLAQKSYEHMARIRIAREAPPECNCPPGPPGKRGKRGRRGEIGAPVSTTDILLDHLCYQGWGRF
ncbi:collagen alpha-1(XXV) chain-like [Rhineura floridana]|uniref:collagen alpha-1(XXV) chain-like n=1 Tax=Rhineura floridana TaxID=261503 RepID=UPI002AC8711A|nr:collagen alpha-1(XXV) chain-like [Rhineura floridana]